MKILPTLLLCLMSSLALGQTVHTATRENPNVFTKPNTFQQAIVAGASGGNGMQAIYLLPDINGNCAYYGDGTTDQLSDVFGVLLWNPSGTGFSCQQVMMMVPYASGFAPTDQQVPLWNALLGGFIPTSTAGPISGTVAHGTATMGTSLIGSGACASAVTVVATGVVTTDVIDWNPNGDPTGVTGYAPAAGGILKIWSYPTSGNVNFKVCNNTGGSITPAALTLNWSVRR